MVFNSTTIRKVLLGNLIWDTFVLMEIPEVNDWIKDNKMKISNDSKDKYKFYSIKNYK